MQHREEATGFDRFVEELQQQVVEQARAVYSDKVIEEALHPNNLWRMAEPDAQATVQGWCDDTMEIYLRLDGEIIEDAAFMMDGCGPSIACGSKLTSMVQGMPLEKASSITPEDLLAALDGLPEDSQHCAQLAVNTLQRVISNWRKR